MFVFIKGSCVYEGALVFMKGEIQLGFGFGILNFGFRILDFGLKILDFGAWTIM